MDDAERPRGSGEGLPDLPSDAEPRREPPSYDDEIQGYTGISEGTLGDVDDARAFAEMIVDTVREGLLVLDTDLRVRAANESFYRMFGMGPEETVGRAVYDIGGGQWALPELRELLEGILPHRKAFDDYEVEHEVEGLGRRCMLLNARRLNHHRMILLAIEDVTERRQGERELRRSEERFRLLVENAREYAIFSTDEEKRITVWSPSAERILGWSQEEALGMSAAAIFTAEDRAVGVPEREMARARATGSALDERWHVRKDGSRFWASGMLVALQEELGQGKTLRGFAKILRDHTDRKEAEDALRESQVMLQLVLDHIPQGVFWKDRDGRFLGTNVVAARSAGLERSEDLVGLTDYDLPGVTAEQAAFFRQKDREVMASGEPALGIEEPLGRPDGSTSWLRTNKVSLRDAAGHVVGVLGTWEDVTERKRTREALRQSEERFRSVSESGVVAIAFFDATGAITDANDAFLDLIGYARAEIEAGEVRWDRLTPPEWMPRTRAAVERLEQTGRIEPYEKEYFRKDGGRFWGLFGGRRIESTGEGVAFVLDITERKRAEAALRENEERLRRAQQAAHVGTWDVDLVTGEVTWSEGVFDLVGLPPEGGVPSADTWAALLHPDDRERVPRQVKAVIETGGPYENEFRVVRPDGEVVWVAAKGHVLREAGGRPVRLLGANYDVTARKRTEEALRRANETLEERVEERTRQVRALSRALALAEQEERRRIAHVLHDDLQQLLFAAKVTASLGNAERLEDVLGRAMGLTRTLSHSLSPPFLEGEDVEDLLRWIAVVTREQFGLELEVEVRRDVPIPDPALRVLLYQLVRELLFNVAKHAGTDLARLVVERVDDHVRVVVEDEGPGFDPDVLDEPSAAGLGLRGVRERVELVGGRLEVESVRGRGTRVTIIVPVAP